MARKSCLLAMIFVTFSCASVSAATSSIGTISARGDIRVDGYSVWGNGTLFDGTTVETGQATATLRLDNGTEIVLAINTHGMVYGDRLVLLEGRSQLKTLSAPFTLEAHGLRVIPSEPNSFGVVSLGPSNTVDVAAIAGDFRVVDEASLAAANVSGGAAISFPAVQTATAPQGSSFIGVSGKVSYEDGNFFLTTDKGVKYELVTGEELKKFKGKTVDVSGFLQTAPTSSGLTQVIVTSIDLSGGAKGSTGMTTQTKVLIGAGIGGGGAVAAIVGAEASKSSASR
ncbi:MAG TPA: hypothetical protein VMT38_10825 [Terracidiphilus sp.]|nr:hypothetical protein [Terracidiphilus sp.]